MGIVLMETIKALNVYGQPCHLWRATDAEGHTVYAVTRDRGRLGHEIRSEPASCTYRTQQAAINAAEEDIAIEVQDEIES